MSLALPTLRGTAQQALYPFRRTVKCSTLVSLNQDGSQQRSILDNPRMLFELVFKKLNAADKNSMNAFAASALGQFANNEVLTLGNVAYDNLSVNADLFSTQNPKATMWNSALKLTQTQPQNLQPTTTITSNINSSVTDIPVAAVAGFNNYITIDSETMLITWTPDGTDFTVLRAQLGTVAASHTSGATVSWGPKYSLGQAFPALPNGARTQVNWQQNQNYKTEVSQLNAGPKFTFPWYGGHLIGFPTTGLQQWTIGGDGLTDQEVAVLEAHFLANWGRFSAFTFTDPETGTTYANAYYTTDEMTVEYVEPNVNKVALTVEAYNTGSGIASAILSIVTSHVPGTGFAAEAQASFELPWGFAPNTFFSGFFLNNNASWSGVTNTANMTTLINSGLPPFASVASFCIQGTGSGTGSASPPDEFTITDCFITVTYTDGSTAVLRATQYQILQFNGTVTGASSTTGVLERSTFSPLDTATTLQFTNFV